ncbi:GNAT family N-acetyltransferase [Salinicola acroporae]|uniref:GNAT family N-acetyltransferase n=1 Tax=Salinicola acroporae TaxID=1541440 RepID=UPI0019802828|nr:GNAT family N-acetyltransferase [Salinicola acroporae]
MSDTQAPRFDRENRTLTLIDCEFDLHGDAVLTIFNDAILNTTALYEYRPRTRAVVEQWFQTKREGDFPILGMLDGDSGRLMGFASYGPFRPHAAYRYSVEHSVYVDGDFRQRGVARHLMTALIARAEAQQYHTLIGGIDAANAPSIVLHERLGFEHAGTVRQAAFKFGRWLDLAFYQRILATPERPRAE